jgi:hypothetical protein
MRLLPANRPMLLPYDSSTPRSDNPAYVAHGLALLNEIRTWYVVKDAVKKKLVFSSTSIASGKRADTVGEF